MADNELVGPTHIYTLFDPGFKVLYPTYTQSPACGKPLRTVLYLDGKESNEAWLGRDPIGGFFNIYTGDRKNAGAHTVVIVASLN